MKYKFELWKYDVPSIVEAECYLNEMSKKGWKPQNIFWGWGLPVIVFKKRKKGEHPMKYAVDVYQEQSITTLGEEKLKAFYEELGWAYFFRLTPVLDATSVLVFEQPADVYFPPLHRSEEEHRLRILERIEMPALNEILQWLLGMLLCAGMMGWHLYDNIKTYRVFDMDPILIQLECIEFFLFFIVCATGMLVRDCAIRIWIRKGGERPVNRLILSTRRFSFYSMSFFSALGILMTVYQVLTGNPPSLGGDYLTICFSIVLIGLMFAFIQIVSGVRFGSLLIAFGFIIAVSVGIDYISVIAERLFL